MRSLSAQTCASWTWRKKKLFRRFGEFLESPSDFLKNGWSLPKILGVPSISILNPGIRIFLENLKTPSSKTACRKERWLKRMGKQPKLRGYDPFSRGHGDSSWREGFTFLGRLLKAPWHATHRLGRCTHPTHGHVQSFVCLKPSGKIKNKIKMDRSRYQQRTSGSQK